MPTKAEWHPQEGTAACRGPQPRPRAVWDARAVLRASCRYAGTSEKIKEITVILQRI